ncbi:MAG TPA: transglutaminase domain-containing protein [Actinocrinis sp.]|nr:transglutaminase domain-containing protein [Actinocrinis sp.]
MFVQKCGCTLTSNCRQSSIPARWSLVTKLRTLVEPLLRIPDEFRRFDTTPVGATRDLGLDAAAQRVLLDAGLPHVGDGDEVLFDSLDLSTISLYLSARSARRDAMRFWQRSLRRIASGPVGYRVEVRAQCPLPRHSGDCIYQVAPEAGGRTPVVTSERRGVALGAVSCWVQQRPEPLPPVLAELAMAYADVDFYYLPTFLSLNADFVERERIGDCAATARAILDTAVKAGFEARHAYGFILAVPYSSTHTWTEIRLEGRWFAVDPLLPKAMRAWGITKGDEWPATLSPLGVYRRVATEQIRLAWHGQVPCHTWLPTEIAK